MLDKFIRIYTIVVSIIIVATLCTGGYCYFAKQQVYAACGCLFMAVIFSMILFVTRLFVRNMKTKGKKMGARR